MKHRSKTIVIIFAILLAIVPVASFIMPDMATSTVERRPIAQWMSLGEFQKENVSSRLSDYFASIEDYLLDQFPLRDKIRSISALSRRYLLLQLDHNQYFKVKGHLGKLDFNYREKAAINAINLFNRVYTDHFSGGKGKHLFALIPDKNHYMTRDSVYPAVETELFMKTLREHMNLSVDKVSLDKELSLDFYYRTDPHWNQQHLRPIADALLSNLNHRIRVSDLPFEKLSLGTFLGTYAGQAALPIKPDDFIYLNHPSIERARVYDPIKKDESSVYRFDKRDSIDPYDFFLGGARPIFLIRNGQAEGERKLVVFRDSFGSSLVPLLIPAYGEILVVDLRYVRAEAIKDELHSFFDADVLFLYSTTVLNAPGAFPIS